MRVCERFKFSFGRPQVFDLTQQEREPWRIAATLLIVGETDNHGIIRRVGVGRCRTIERVECLVVRRFQNVSSTHRGSLYVWCANSLPPRL